MTVSKPATVKKYVAPAKVNEMAELKALVKVILAEVAMTETKFETLGLIIESLESNFKVARDTSIMAHCYHSWEKKLIKIDQKNEKEKIEKNT